MTGGEVEIVESAHEVDVEELEDVVHTHDELEVGLATVHDITAVGEVHQSVAAGVLRQERIVLVAEAAPEGVDGDVFAPLELLQQRDTVEKLSVHIPRQHHRGVVVVEELHVVDEVVHLLLDDVRLVGGWLDQEHVGHLVPLDAALEEEVHLTPAVKPEALVDLRLGDV